jgi:enoyl-[acyl-carrier protein] reductase II
MLRTRLGALLGIPHPVVLGGMGLGTNPQLVAAVSNAGGLGIQGCARRSPGEVADLAASIRALTDRPFGMNLLLFVANNEAVAAVMSARPPVFSSAWARADQDLARVFALAHDAGSMVMHMVSTVADATRVAEAGADVIVVMGTMVLVPMVARAVAPIPVIAAGGLADGAGLAAALMTGAEGALFGTRFLATTEASIPDRYKQVIVDTDGHNSVVTEIPDVATGVVWPGAYARVERNRFIERWLGREGELRYRQREVAAATNRALETGDVDEAILYTGQSAGLIDAVEPAAAVVERIVGDATALLQTRAASLLG